MSYKLTQDKFLEKSKSICANRLGLDKFIYTKSSSQSIATCLVDSSHGDFFISPNKILNGGGCPLCAKNKIKTLEEVFSEIEAVHGTKYSLTDNSMYSGTNTRMELLCNSCKKPFLITPKKCKLGQGCRECSRAAANKTRAHTFEYFKSLSSEVFGEGVFIYDKNTYHNFNTPTTIWCRVHGSFSMSPKQHLKNKYGCPECSSLARGRETTRKFTEDFLSLAREIHGDTYNYDNFVYVDFKTKGEIVCKKHGAFWMTPDTHISSKCGCRRCSHITSRAQDDLLGNIEGMGLLAVSNFKLNNDTEIDIFIPSLNIGIEYNGLRWHSDKFRNNRYHLDKTLQCNTQGIHLIHIFEDEWLFKKDIVLNLLVNSLGKSTTKYDARKCKVEKLQWKEFSEFLNKTHLQGCGVAPTYKYGLTYDGELVSVMGFSSRDSGGSSIELVRFSSKGIVRGGFSKLLKTFIRDYGGQYDSIVSFSDKRWSRGNVYSSNGFKYIHTTDIDYWYVSRLSREDKRGYQHKYLKEKLEVYNPLLSEVENCRNNGLHRIFDCGKDKWEFKLK